MLKIVTSKEKSTQEQAQMQDAMRFAALEINFVDQGFPVSPRVRELVRLIPEATYEWCLPEFMLIDDGELESVMKTIDRKALAKATLDDVMDILDTLHESADDILHNKETSRYRNLTKWKPIYLRALDAQQQARGASFFLPGVPDKDPNTGGWRFNVLAVYRDIKVSIGYVLVNGEEATVELKDNWKGFFLESHILWLYKNSVALSPGQ